MSKEPLSLGKSQYKKNFQQFDLTTAELGDLSGAITASVSVGQEITVSIGGTIVLFKYGSEMGNATRLPGDRLIFESNRTDLLQLANDLRELSEATDVYAHLHLEPVYMIPSPSVSDIVFQISN